MRILRLPNHPEFSLPSGEPRHFGSVWEVELESGESTQPHHHEELEEIYCFVEGEGEIIVGQKKKPVVRGEVIHIPKLTCHWVENNSRGLLRCLTIEGPAAPRAPQGSSSADEEGAEPQKETVGSLEKKIATLPQTMDRVEAIKHIVALFDIAGRLSEQIEQAFGLDNEEGLDALGRIEKRIMDAVVEITRRYQLTTGLDLGEFGGRIGRS